MPSWSTPNSPPTSVNGITRPVDPVSTSKGTGDPVPTEAFTIGSVPPTTVSGTVALVPLTTVLPSDVDDPVPISGRPNRNSVGRLITLMISCWTPPSSPPRGPLAAGVSELSAEPTGLLAAEFSELSVEPTELAPIAADAWAVRFGNAVDH